MADETAAVGDAPLAVMDRMIDAATDALGSCDYYDSDSTRARTVLESVLSDGRLVVQFRDGRSATSFWYTEAALRRLGLTPVGYPWIRRITWIGPEEPA